MLCDYSVLWMPLSVEKCVVVYYGANNPKHYKCRANNLSEAESTVDLGIM